MQNTKIKLPNGELLILEVGADELSIGHSTESGDERWICSIDRKGCIVYANSGDGPESLTSGLRAGQKVALADSLKPI